MCTDAHKLQGQVHFPSSPRRGGRDNNRISRSNLCGADGVVSKIQQKLLVVTHHPGCAAKVAAQLFLDRAATPPQRGGERALLKSLEQHSVSATTQRRKRKT